MSDGEQPRPDDPWVGAPATVLGQVAGTRADPRKVAEAGPSPTSEVYRSTRPGGGKREPIFVLRCSDCELILAEIHRTSAGALLWRRRKRVRVERYCRGEHVGPGRATRIRADLLSVLMPEPDDWIQLSCPRPGHGWRVVPGREELQALLDDPPTRGRLLLPPAR